MIHPRNVEGLAILNEECSEVQHIVSKILRHGFDSYNPNDLYKIPNTKLLEVEIGNLLYAIGLSIELFGLSKNIIGMQISRKSQEIYTYTHEIDIPKENWIKDLIHHRDTTVGLIATDKEPSYHAKSIIDIFNKECGDPMSSDNVALFQKGIETYLTNITFKID